MSIAELQSKNYATRQLWLAARTNSIGASDSAAILGVGYANQSPITIWNSKVNGSKDDDVEQRLHIGRLIEPSLRSIFNFVTGWPCESPGEYTILYHPEHPWLSATVDAITEHPVYGTCPVELKNVGHFLKADWEDEDPPLKFQIQVQHQLAVTGSSHGFLMGLIGGNEPVIKEIPRDDRFIDVLIKHLRTFWGYVERQELPPVDGSTATTKAINKMFTEEEGLSVCLPPEAVHWATELERAKEEKKAADTRENEFANKIKAAIGTATFGDIPGWGRFSFKTQTVPAHMRKESTFRVLRKVKS